MNTQLLLVEEADGGLLRLTLNRERQHNALSFALLDELRGCLEGYAENPSVKCVILTGAGNKSFCAGGDLHELDGMRSLEQAREVSRIGRRALDAVRYFPVPVAAALNGAALGGGAELALACDVALAAVHTRPWLPAGQPEPDDCLGRRGRRDRPLRPRKRHEALA